MNHFFLSLLSKMTGPCKGKVPIKIHFFLNSTEIPCDAYIHVKGYADANITHLDIEGFNVDSVKDKIPAVVIGGLNEITIILLEKISIGNRKSKKLKIKGLDLLAKGKKSGAYVGIKKGGIYIGFRKEIIRKLEEIAKSIEPDLFDKTKSLLDFI